MISNIRQIKLESCWVLKSCSKWCQIGWI